MSRKKRRHKPASADRFVLIHEYEMDSAAFRTMTCTARALLLEFRRKYYGRENRIIFSVRDMASQLGLTEKTATRARDELLIRGWIIRIERGSFSRKAKLASVYALTHVPLSASDQRSLKLYMRWNEGVDYRKSSVGDLTCHGGNFSHAPVREPASAGPISGKFSHRNSKIPAFTVGKSPTHVELPSGAVPDGAVDVASAFALAGGLAGAVWVNEAASPVAALVAAPEPCSAEASSGAAANEQVEHSDWSPCASTTCPCGGRTSKRSAEHGKAELLWQECARCGRAGRHRFDDGTGKKLRGAEAVKAFAAMEHASPPGAPSLTRGCAR